MRAGYEESTIGRSYAALREWFEQEQIRGVWGKGGRLWESHPSWSSPADRENWHKNWGELLNYHTTAHIRRININGGLSFRLDVRVTHPDTARLELVKSVTGGTIEGASGPRTVRRLRIERMAAFLALKAGRLYVDPANGHLFDVLDAAMDFYKYVPERGQAATDTQITYQEAAADRLDALIGVYTGAQRLSHDCSAALIRAGSCDWTADPPPINPDRVYF